MAVPTEPMRVSRDELRFDFGEARFRLPRDRALLAWIVDQFLYGEVTGIQCRTLALRRSLPRGRHLLRPAGE